MDSASDRLRRRDLRIRLQLAGMTLCWVGLAVANLSVSESVRWYPDVVGALAAVTAAFTLSLAVFPRFFFAFRFGGALGICTLALRLASIIEGMALALDQDFLWLGIAALCVTTMLISCYWMWWLREVKTWHETHKKKSGPRR